MLAVLGQVTHGLDDLLRSLDVPAKDHPDTDLITVFRLVFIAAVVVAMATGDLFP
ncbi:hypothetical protein D3C86_2151540 [compost metagenome]